MISTAYYFKMILSLGVVMAVIYTVTRLIKRFGLAPQQFRGELKIVDRVALSQTVAMVIVEVRGTSYLASVSPNGIQILETLSS